MTFPDALRGIRVESWLTPDETGRTCILPEAFKPDDRTAEKRDDGWAETSINWFDNEAVLASTVAGSSGQFGAALVPFSEILRIEHSAATNGQLGHERKPVEGNDNHGNLIFRATKKGVATPIRKMLLNALSLASHFVPQTKR